MKPSLNRKDRRAIKKHNNAELKAVVERQVRTIYFLEREVARLKKLVPPIDHISPFTGEITRINPETKETITI